jgi:hypothetical protein
MANVKQTHKNGKELSMLDNENIVENGTTENVEITTEQIEAPAPKTFTQDEVNEIVGRRLARQEMRIKKDYDRKYGELEEVLKAGTGENSVEGMTTKFKEFYQGKGIKMPEKPTYSDRDLDVLARAEANDVIDAGYEDVVAEIDRLAEIGANNMTPREKAVFRVLAEHRQNTERQRELSSIGVTEEEYNSQEFKDFRNKFNASTSIRDIYDLYNKTKPKKEFKTMGSVKNTESTDSGVKDFYTPEEARKFTKKDFDDNPALFKAVENSMLKWKR